MSNIKTGEDRREAVVDAMELGYVIQLEKRGNSVYVTFFNKTGCEYRFPHSYSEDIPGDDIKQDCIYDLFRWAGLKYEKRLTLDV